MRQPLSCRALVGVVMATAFGLRFLEWYLMGQVSSSDKLTSKCSSLQNKNPRPRDLRIVFIGDSLTRYTYLSLVYFLRWGQWYDPSHRTPHLVQESSFATPFHNQTWWEFSFQTNRMLYPLELCDCYRKLPGKLQVNKVSNNRYFYDPEFNNAVAYLDAKGHKGSIHGRIPANDVFNLLVKQQEQAGDFSSPVQLLSPPFDNLTRPFPWAYTSWADAIRQYISHLNPPPQYIVLNAGLWPNNFLYQPDLVSDLNDAIHTMKGQGIWKTTTYGLGGTVMYDSIPPTDDYMCQQLDHCWNVSWTKELAGRWYWDGKHFWEPVYRAMNENFLEQINALPEGYQKLDRSILLRGSD